MHIQRQEFRIGASRLFYSSLFLLCAGFIVYLLDSICGRIPRGQDKFLVIVDLKGWGYSNCDVRAYIAAIEIMQVGLSICS